MHFSPPTLDCLAAALGMRISGSPALRRKIFPLFFRSVFSVLPLAHFPSMGSDDPPLPLPPTCRKCENTGKF